MSRQKAESALPKQKATADAVPTKLSEAEQDLVWPMEHGYELETDSLGAAMRLKKR